MEYVCTVHIQALDNRSISFSGKCLKIWKSPSKCENSKCVHLQLKPLECFSRALKAQVLKFPTLSLGKILCVPFSSAKLKGLFSSLLSVKWLTKIWRIWRKHSSNFCFVSSTTFSLKKLFKSQEQVSPQWRRKRAKSSPLKRSVGFPSVGL